MVGPRSLLTRALQPCALKHSRACRVTAVLQALNPMFKPCGGALTGK